MTLTVPCSVSCLSFNPETSFTIWRNNCVASCKFPGKTTNLKLFPQRIMSRPSASDLSFPHYKCGSYLSHNARLHILSASGIDVAGEEVDRPLADEEATGSPGTQADQTNKVSSLGLNAPPIVPRRPRPTRKSDMPAVNTEELIPGATFTGKVRSVHPFGAFVDIGAFTNGLVHISRLSDKFVKDVGNIVSVGQEVKVRVVEANSETGRISFTMRENGVTGKLKQQKDAPISAVDSLKPARRSHEDLSQKRAKVNKISKFVKGHKLKGTVKKLTRAGAFISLPEEEDGFLPTSEEAGEGLGSTMEGSSLRVGQEVDVCVLRVSRGQVTLTMKKDENSEELGNEIRASIVHTATNPFVLAFRENKELAAFLEERKRTEKTEISLTPVELVQDHPPQSNIGSAITSSSGEEIENEEEISIKGGDDRVSFI